MRDPYAWIDPFVFDAAEGQLRSYLPDHTPLDPRDWPEDGDYRDSFGPISRSEAMAHARGIATPRDQQLAEMRRDPVAFVRAMAKSGHLSDAEPWQMNALEKLMRSSEGVAQRRAGSAAEHQAPFPGGEYVAKRLKPIRQPWWRDVLRWFGL